MPVAQPVQRPIIILLLINDVERMWKEAVVAELELLTLDLGEQTGNSLKPPS
jgi:hypothetical protein